MRSAPQIRLDLYRDETGNRGDILVFALHHGFADAHGNISVASAVMNTYIRLAEDPGYVPKYKGRYPRDTKTIPERFTPEQREEAAKLTEISFEPNWSFVCGDVSRGKIFDYTGEYPRGGKRFSVRTISPENFRKIKAFGKRNGATINDLMVGASSSPFSSPAAASPTKNRPNACLPPATSDDTTALISTTTP
ncbi:MAG: hypothetical protein II861_05910 [Methanomicrobium sp.]|nr:hypothetical protein [Methanomicrobium sp.]